MKEIDLIIIDCDGTLVDSEIVHQAAIVDTLEKLGIEGYTLEYCLEHFAGRGMSNIVKQLEEKIGGPVPEQFIPDYINDFQGRISSELKAVPFAIESVRSLSSGYKICVASNGEDRNVTASLKAVSLYDIFGKDRIFTKSRVARGKPFPDLFLYAASQMGTSPEKCIVVEDGITGVQAGVAAGMYTIGLTATSHNREQAEKDMKNAGVSVICPSWAEVLSHIDGVVDRPQIAPCNNF